jgi:hypothetical protein
MNRNQFEVAMKRVLLVLLFLPWVAELVFEGYSVIERKRHRFSPVYAKPQAAFGQCL